jgi:hypothetical protein
MSSTETKSFLFNAKTVGARIHCAVFVAALAGVLTFGTEASAQMQCDQGWNNIWWDEATLTLLPGVKVSRNGTNYAEYELSDLNKGQRLLIEVGSRQFRPRLEVYQVQTRPRVLTPVISESGNPAAIMLVVPEEGDYLVVVTTSSPGQSGQYSWAHALCEQVASDAVTAKGPACDADWHRGKANYRKRVGEPIYWPDYQKFCSLGRCSFAGSDNQGNTWPTGFRTFSTATQTVEVWAELYDPRLKRVFYCKDK